MPPTPIRLHPENPKCFEFRGKPLVLVTATEHYGAVMNRPFRFERYLADAAEKRHHPHPAVRALPRTAERHQSLLDVQAGIAGLHRAVPAHRARAGAGWAAEV